MELNQCSFLHFKMAQIQPEIREKEITALSILINHSNNKSIILGEILWTTHCWRVLLIETAQ